MARGNPKGWLILRVSAAIRIQNVKIVSIMCIANSGIAYLYPKA